MLQRTRMKGKNSCHWSLLSLNVSQTSCKLLAYSWIFNFSGSATGEKRGFWDNYREWERDLSQKNYLVIKGGYPYGIFCEINKYFNCLSIAPTDRKLCLWWQLSFKIGIKVRVNLSLFSWLHWYWVKNKYTRQQNVKLLRKC